VPVLDEMLLAYAESIAAQEDSDTQNVTTPFSQTGKGHNPANGTLCWQHVTRDRVESTGRGWMILIPRGQVPSTQKASALRAIADAAPRVSATILGMSAAWVQHAFVSYVHEDVDAVDQLVSALQAASIPVWKDTQDLWPGEDWQQKIREAIEDGSLAFIACFSTSSVQKTKTYMNAELNLAVEQIRLMKPGHVWLLPVRLDDCELPRFDIGGNRTLNSLQRIDLFGPMREANLARLLTSITGIFGTSATTPASADAAIASTKDTVQNQTAEAQRPVDSPSTRLDQLETLLDEQNRDDSRNQNLIIEALNAEVSPVTVARAMTVANIVGALPWGEITLHASTDPMIDLTFSWQHHIGDGRFSEPSGNFLGITAHVAADPGGGTPVIQTTWPTTEKTETVIRRINGMLQHRDRWNGPKTIDWVQVFRDLHRAIVLSVAYKRRDSEVDWQLHGGLYELHGQDWAITEAGIEHRPGSQVVLSEAEFPERTAYPGRNGSADPEGWPPSPPAEVDLAEWQHLLWRGRWHFPVNRGPFRTQPNRWPCKTFP
jgi:TIR domain